MFSQSYLCRWPLRDRALYHHATTNPYCEVTRGYTMPWRDVQPLRFSLRFLAYFIQFRQFMPLV